MKLHNLIIVLTTAVLSIFCACEDGTGTIGDNVMPGQDLLSTYNETFSIPSRSVRTDSVLATTSNCYIGSIIDPETQAITTCSFLAQFHLQEGYSMPPIDKVIKDSEGRPVADSCVIRIFHDKFYGDSLTTMRLTATELSLDNVMKEDTTYYTNIHPEDYLSTRADRTQASAIYTVIDQNLSSSATNLSSGNYRSITVNLGTDYGNNLLRSYYEHPEYYKNSNTFINNVCPGFYIEHTGGVGTIINSDVSVLDVYYRIQENDTTITNAWIRLGATQEVLQNTRVNHTIPASLLDDANPYTYIKSPAGIHTELTLPVDEIASGAHSQDTINSARFTLRRFVESGKSTLSPPTHILLIRKGHAEEFFKKKNLPDNITTFLCEYSSTTNAYTFNNIAPLIAYLRKMRDNEAGVLETDTEATILEKRKAWQNEHPDWQTFELVPVTPEYTTSSSYYGNTKILVGLQNDYNLHSVKLEGGQRVAGNGKVEGDIQLNVIYSHFKSDDKK